MKYAEMMIADPDALREHYASCRELAHNNGRIAQQGPRAAKKAARSMGYLMRQIDMVENVARKRGLSLVAA